MEKELQESVNECESAKVFIDNQIMHYKTLSYLKKQEREKQLAEKEKELLMQKEKLRELLHRLDDDES